MGIDECFGGLGVTSRSPASWWSRGLAMHPGAVSHPGRKRSRPFAPAGAFGVGDDVGGGAASAARPCGAAWGATGAVFGDFGGISRGGERRGGDGPRRDDVDFWGLRGRLRGGFLRETLARMCAVRAAGTGKGRAGPGTKVDGDGGEGDLGDGVGRGKAATDEKGGDVPEPFATSTALDEAPVCRFCFEEAEPGVKGGNLVTPCACSGSQANIHLRCLLTWQNTAAWPRDAPVRPNDRHFHVSTRA